MLLIQLIRRGEQGKSRERSTSVSLETRNDEFFERFSNESSLIWKCVGQKFSFEQLCDEFASSRTVLKSLFKSRASSGVMEYYIRLKLERFAFSPCLLPLF